MSTDSPIKFNPDRVLTPAQKDINYDPRYWDWFEQWWAQDFSWEGLAKQQWNDSPDTSINLQEYWSEYVEKDDLVIFGQNDYGTSRKWTILHLPPHDRNGKKSPKHENFQGEGAWKTGISSLMHLTGPIVEFDRVITDILTTSGPVVAHANQDERAHLEGVFFPKFYTNKHTSGIPVYVICDWCCLSSSVLFEYEPNGRYPDKSICPTIGARSRLEKACFLGALFTEFNICDFTSFKNSIFLSQTDFSDVAFGEDVSFEHCLFTFPVSFRCPSSDKFHYKEAPTNFISAQFISDVWFSNRTFEEMTNFSGAFFYKLANFHGCTFHQDTSFAEAEFGLPTNNENAEEYQRAFRTLRQLMEKNGASAEAFKFAKLEMQAKERRVGSIDVPWWERFGSRFYGFTVDYGQNAVWPLLWLSAAWLFASFGYSAIAQIDHPIAHSFSDAAAVAFQYSLPPVSTFAAQFFAGEVNENFVDALLDHPFLTRLVMVTHGVASLALVFFLLLALKRRFQIR